MLNYITRQGKTEEQEFFSDINCQVWPLNLIKFKSKMQRVRMVLVYSILVNEDIRNATKACVLLKITMKVISLAPDTRLEF